MSHTRQTLRSRLIRLAHENPQLRGYLLDMLKTAAKWIPVKKITFLDEFLSHASTGMTKAHHKGDVLESTSREILDGVTETQYSYSKEGTFISIRKTVTVTQRGKSSKKVMTYTHIDPSVVVLE